MASYLICYDNLIHQLKQRRLKNGKEVAKICLISFAKVVVICQMNIEHPYIHYFSYENVNIFPVNTGTIYQQY